MVLSSRLESALDDLNGIADVIKLLATTDVPEQLSSQAIYWLGKSVSDERDIINEELAVIERESRSVAI